MKKGKWLLLLGSVCTLILFSLFEIGYVEGRSRSITVVSGSKLNKLKGSLRDVSEQEEISLSLSFAGEKLPYHASQNTFYLPLDMDREDYEEGVFTATLGEDDANVIFEEDFKEKPKLEWMQEGGKIPLLVTSQNSYAECYLTLTGMSLIDFTQTEYMLGELPVFEIRVYDAKAKHNWVETCYTTSKIRGNTSYAYEKKSLRLNLVEKKTDGSFEKTSRNFLGLRDDNDWILNGLYSDDAKIRDMLANELWNETGALSNPYGKLWGTGMEYVEIFVNDGYMGLYGLMYPIDRKQLGTQAVSKQLEAGNPVVERLYKKKWKIPWEKEGFCSVSDENMPDYRGGFYLKGDTLLKDDTEWEPLYLLAECIEADDETFAQGITELADQTNILENWLFYNGIAGFDNEIKNYYYLVKDRNGEPYGYFIPWDLNLSFGDVYAENMHYAEYKESVVHDPVAWEPAVRMIDLDVADSRRILQATWQKWRSDVFATDHVLERMDELYNRLTRSGAYAREKARYPDGRYTGDIEHIKRFAKERLAWLDEYIDDL